MTYSALFALHERVVEHGREIELFFSIEKVLGPLNGKLKETF
jgi:hypothetical protein